MKNFFLIAILAALFVSSAFAGPEDVAKQRAKQFGNKLNEQQGVPPAPPRPSTPQTAPVQQTPAQPAVSPAVAKLRSNLTVLTNSTVTAQQKQQLAKDFLATSQGAAKPSQQTATKLANDLSATLAGKTISSTDQTRLSQNIISLFNGANLSQTQVQAVALDVQTILQTSGVKRAEAVVVVADLKAIAAETQKKP